MLSAQRFLSLSVCLLAAHTSFADDAFRDPPGNSSLVVSEDFTSSELPEALSPTIGSWSVRDGSLLGSEKPEDQHAAAARYRVETENAVYQMRFKLAQATKAFHFGFDPAKGELDKKGHLFSVIITPTSWKILKHVDKKRPQEDPNEVLASAKTDFKPERWYDFRVTTWENFVTAKIDGKEPLKASHPTFGVKKPTLVFRTAGQGVEVTDLEVWKEN